MTDLVEVYRRHRTFVRSCLRRSGVDHDRLDDAEQDVFVVLIRRIADYDRRYSHRQWLSGISRRVAWGYRARARRDPTALENAPPPVSETERWLESRATLDRFLAAVDSSVLEPYVLNEVEGRSAREIAAMLELPLTTVQWRIRSARRQLQAAARERTTGRAAGLVPVWPQWIGRFFERMVQSLMPANCAALGLLGVLAAQPPAEAAEPATSTIVVQDEVEGLAPPHARVVIPSRARAEKTESQASRARRASGDVVAGDPTVAPDRNEARIPAAAQRELDDASALEPRRRFARRASTRSPARRATPAEPDKPANTASPLRGLRHFVFPPQLVRGFGW